MVIRIWTARVIMLCWVLTALVLEVLGMGMDFASITAVLRIQSKILAGLIPGKSLARGAGKLLGPFCQA